MPGMDGYEVLRCIRGAPSTNGHRSVAIALTALASDSERRAVLAAGFDDHLVKPFNFADLLRAVSRLPDITGDPDAGAASVRRIDP